jgi:hypothetical protein
MWPIEATVTGQVPASVDDADSGTSPLRGALLVEEQV